MLYELLDFTEGQFPPGLGWHDKIVAGFPQSSLWSLSRALGVEPHDTAELVGVPQEDINWRKRATLLSPSVSDKLFQISKAYQRLLVPLKDEDMVRDWLRTAQSAVGNQIPVVLLMTQPGAAQVIAAIDAIKPLKSVEMNPIFDEPDEEIVAASDSESVEEPDEAALDY